MPSFSFSSPLSTRPFPRPSTPARRTRPPRSSGDRASPTCSSTAAKEGSASISAASTTLEHSRPPVRGALKMLLRMLLAAALVGSAVPAGAQQRPNSPVLKSYVPTDAHSLVLPGDASYELWQEFSLVRKANDGDPVAQHELGIRYISGKGFPADTAKAAYWIGKAAAQNLPSARYNLAILENNGWGCPWAPFQAYADVLFAAGHG